LEVVAPPFLFYEAYGDEAYRKLIRIMVVAAWKCSSELMEGEVAAPAKLAVQLAMMKKTRVLSFM
jgi:hypothetical protein